MANFLTRAMRRMRGKTNGETPPHTTRGWEVLSGNANWQDANDVWKNFSEAQLQDIAVKHALVYACIDAIAGRVHEAPLGLYRQTDTGWEAVDNHYLTPVLANPNKVMSGGDLLRFAVANLLATGEAFLWELRDDAKYIGELWPIPSALVEPHWTGNTATPIDYYEVDQGADKAKLRIPAVNMTYIRVVDPRNYQRAIGPLQAASREVQTDESRQDYVMEMLKNLNVPGLAVISETPLGAQQKQDLKARLADVAGPGKRGSTLHLGGKGARVEVIAPLKDLDWPGLNAIDESRICAAFKTPPVVVGARVGLELSGQYANYSTALWHFYTGTLKPLWLFLGEALTRGLVVNEPMEEDNGLHVRFDLDDVQGLQEDADKRAERAARLLTSGVATLAQAVELAGLPPLDPDDPLYGARYMPLTMIRVDEDAPEIPVVPHGPEPGDAASGSAAGGGGDASSGTAAEPAAAGTEENA